MSWLWLSLMHEPAAPLLANLDQRVALIARQSAREPGPRKLNQCALSAEISLLENSLEPPLIQEVRLPEFQLNFEASETENRSRVSSD